MAVTTAFDGTAIGNRQRHRFATAIAAALFGMGLGGAAQAADHSLSNIRIDFGIFAIEIPKIEVRGTPLDLAGVTSLFDAGTSESAVARFSRLNAATITIPELFFDQAIGAQKQRTTYRNIAVSDIAAGKIGKMTVATTGAAMQDPTIGKIEIKAGLTSVEGFDLTLGARFLTEPARPGEKPPFQTLYKSYEVVDYSVDFGPVGTLKLASVKGRDARVRQGETAMATLFTSVMEMAAKQAAAGGQKPKEPSPEELKTIAGMLGVLENFEYGEMDAVGLTGTFKAPDGPVEMRLARIFFTDRAEKGEFRLEGFDLKAGPVKAALGTFSATGFSFKATLAAFAEAMKSGGVDVAIATNPLKFIPKLGSIKTSGLMIEAPDDKTRDAAGKPEINKIGLRASEITIGAQKDGIPTAIKISLDGLTMPISPREKRDGLKDIAGLGYKGIDLSAGIDGAWAEASNEFAISNLSLAGIDMGSIVIAGLLGNITRDVFSGDAALTQVALLGASAKRLDIKVQDKGLFARVLEREAKAKKKSTDDLRKEFGMIAAVGLPAILGPSDGAKAIAAALSRFVAKPGTLNLSASAKSASGIGLADVIAIGEPQAIFEKLDVKASAE